MCKIIHVILINLILLTGCSGTMPNLGVNNNKLAPCPKTPNCVSSQAHDEEHYIDPVKYAGTQQQAHDRLLRIIESEKRTKILTNQKNYIRVEFTSALFRFVDDVEFYFPNEKPDEKIIHVRSASRVGSSDLGVNRKRIERIRSKFHS
ncbi:MAG: DUF1499 domain-containing protein [Gammaproteobacteria bacterium]|nr:DUF1499 domain-containing protein [Gammaproteobacteria bacterium]